MTAPADGASGQAPDVRAVRLAQEDAAVARGLAQLAAGEGLDEEEFENWLQALEADVTSPLPEPFQRPPMRQV